MKEERPIEVGDRFESEDPREEGRVIQIRERRSAKFGMYGSGGSPRWQVQTEAHPKNPEVIGRKSVISEHTLRRRWKRISR